MFEVGVANTVTTGPINARSPRAESKKAIVSLLIVNRADELGFARWFDVVAGC